MRQNIRKASFFISIAVVLIASSGLQAQPKSTIQQQVRQALRDDNLGRRLETLAHLRDTHRRETTEVVLNALDDPERKIRLRAASFIPGLSSSPRITETLISHLQKSKDAGMRLSCAIGLMRVRGASVDAVYLKALKDPSDKVAEIACTELGDRGGAKATAALFQALSHPSWRVRLEVCKALITLKAADRRVVSTLEAMSHEPEAAKYDAEIEKFDQLDKQMGSPPEFKGSWGKIGKILAQARQIAASKSRSKQRTTSQVR